MNHILRVMILQCDGLEPNWEVCFFPEGKLESAIECAKAHLRPDEKTVVQMIPLSSTLLGDGRRNYIWVHDPETCDKSCTCGRHEEHECGECTHYTPGRCPSHQQLS